MGELNFQTSRKTYTVNGGATISFDPTDAKFASAVIAAFRNCSEISQKATSEDFSDVDKAYAATIKMDADIRKEIDTAFGDAVCDKVFAGSSAIGIADGLPVWTNFLMAVIDEIDSNLPDGQARAKDRVQKYMHKYETKYGKYMRK